MIKWQRRIAIRAAQKPPAPQGEKDEKHAVCPDVGGGQGISSCYDERVTLQPFDLNLRHLRAVAAIRRCGSISKAASEVALSQPAVTQGIAKLEAAARPQAVRARAGRHGRRPPAGDRLADRIDAAGRGHGRGLRRDPRRLAQGGFRGTENLVTMSQVRALLALAAAGSFVDAAQASRLSQPSLHRAVRDVERLSGVTLVERRGRGVRLTAGRPAARARLRPGHRGGPGGARRARRRRDTGRIRIGAMPLARARLLPLAIARFHEAAARRRGSTSRRDRMPN